MRLLACSDGASWGLSETLCSWATVSNCGTKTFVTTARPSQKNAISTENRRIASRDPVGPRLVFSLVSAHPDLSTQ